MGSEDEEDGGTRMRRMRETQWELVEERIGGKGLKSEEDDGDKRRNLKQQGKKREEN